MIQLIGKHNKVHYGCIDDTIEWNYKDFILRDFFNKEITGIRKRRAYHQFNYIGITAGEYIVGFAMIDLALIKQAFGFLYKAGEGMLVTCKSNCLGISKKMDFPRNPDAYIATFRSKNISTSIEKNHHTGLLQFDCNFQNRLKFAGRSRYSIPHNSPLRVINPNDPNRFTFTEKCSPIQFDQFQLSLDGQNLEFDQKQVTALYDWSGGYLKKETNWYWSALSAVLPDGTPIGVNLAAFVNETYFSENAFWIDGTRTRISRIIYDFDPINPYEPWHIYNEAKTVDLLFSPKVERGNTVHAGFLGKTMFRQFVGTFEGHLTPESGNKVQFSDIMGFCEINRAVW